MLIKALVGILALVLVGGALLYSRLDVRASDKAAVGPRTEATVYGFTLPLNDGTPKALKDYEGRVLLIVNTASKCGFTPQYEGLEKLYETYKDKGFVVLGFPSNDFLGQEPGSDAEIAQFCRLNYGVTFPVFTKSRVKGKDMNPLYRFLTEQSGFDGDISWNFNKFLVDRKGRVVARFGSRTAPQDEELVKAVEGALASAS
ncbi:MAG: glutathione peroxidase [Acidobacteriota bacterium]